MGFPNAKTIGRGSPLARPRPTGGVGRTAEGSGKRRGSTAPGEGKLPPLDHKSLHTSTVQRTQQSCDENGNSQLSAEAI